MDSGPLRDRVLVGQKICAPLKLFYLLHVSKFGQINGFPIGCAASKTRFLETFFNFWKRPHFRIGKTPTPKFCFEVENVLVFTILSRCPINKVLYFATDSCFAKEQIVSTYMSIFFALCKFHIPYWKNDDKEWRWFLVAFRGLWFSNTKREIRTKRKK